MKKNRYEIVVAATVFTTLGLATGWWTAPAGSVEKDDHAGPAASQKISPQTLKNLGVTIAKVETTSFSKHIAIAAVVEETPFTEQPVYAPIGGQVQAISVEPGFVARAGQTLVTIVREPIPRPTLTFTADILKPAQEQIHVTVLDLRKSREEVRISKTELARVEKFTGNVGGKELPILPRQIAIDLRYQLNRSEKALELARFELSKHGFSTSQIDSIASGGPIPKLTQDTWKRALANNGLWTEASEQLHAVLPEDLQQLPWVIATIGELTASGLNTPELVAWIKKEPKAAPHFLIFGVLLQKGHTIADLERLHRLNAFDPVVAVVAPGDGQALSDWDVRRILVKPHARVESGTPLVVLENPRKLYLRTQPVGGEVRALLGAVTDQTPCEARPLVQGSGPVLSDLQVSFVTSDRGGGDTIAYVDVVNEPLSSSESESQPVRRSWQMRPGLKYILRVPYQNLENVFVLPAVAVTEDGPDKIVFIPDGDSFKSVPIEIAYQDDEVVVIRISKDTELFPGDLVVQGGAFALGLALKSGSSRVDAHAGHGH